MEGEGEPSLCLRQGDCQRSEANSEAGRGEDTNYYCRELTAGVLVP